MPITINCPSCGKACMVQDEYAGMQVRCPSCPNVINVPRAGAPAPVAAAPMAPPPPPPGGGFAPPPPPGGGYAPPPPEYAPQQNYGTGPGMSFSMPGGELGLDSLNRLFLMIGLGCLGGMILFSFLPWVTASGPFGSVSALGISSGPGAINLLFSLGAGVYLGLAMFVLKSKLNLNIALYIAAGWSGLAVLWRLINVIEVSGHPIVGMGIGMILALLATLGAGGTLITAMIRRLMKKG